MFVLLVSIAFYRMAIKITVRHVPKSLPNLM